MSIPLLRAAALTAAMLPALAPATPLTLDQALDLAVQRSQAARSARAAVASASEAARAAGQLPDPMLSVGVDNLPVTGADRFSTTAESMTMKRVGISQEWLSAEKRAAREGAARAAIEREAVAEKAAQAETRLQTALAYLDAYYAGEALELTKLTEHHLHEEWEAAKGRLSASAGSSQEVLAMTSARGAAEDESAEVRQGQATASVTLQRWTGRPVDELAPPAMAGAPAEAAYVASHPGVLSAQRDVDVARREAALTAINRKPNWTWQVSYGQRQGYSDMVSFGVSIPLPVAAAERQDRETASKLALVDKAEAAWEDATRAATAEYRMLASDRQRLGERIERYRAGVVVPARQRTQAAMAGYGSNQVSLMTLFEARHAEVEAQRKLLSLQRDLAKVQAQLAFKPLIAGGGQ
ncbi:MAG: TolC family protein [Rhizobacter sp.]